MQLVRPQHLRRVETDEGTPGTQPSCLPSKWMSLTLAAEAITPEKVEGHFDIGDDPATQVVILGATSATIPIDN